MTRSKDSFMLVKRLILMIITTSVLASLAEARININTDAVQKSVVFLYRAHSETEADTTKPLGTAFLVSVPTVDKTQTYLLLVTARHIVEPQWAFCSEPNPSVIFARLNRAQFDPHKDTSGVVYVAIRLRSQTGNNFAVASDPLADAAVVQLTPDTFKGTEYASVTVPPPSVPLLVFATPDDVKEIGVGESVVSAGLVPGMSGEKRNYPFFKFGQISSIPDEPVWLGCEEGMPALKLGRVWFIAANLIRGNSGSPIYYVPQGGGGIMYGGSVGRPVLLGLQSISFIPADIAGMTPIEYVFKIIEGLGLPNADLARGEPAAVPKK